jgi:hypothetical protein
MYARDEDTLIFSNLAHVYPCTLSDGKDVRRVVLTTLVAIFLDDIICV